MRNLRAKFCIFGSTVLLLLTGCARGGTVSRSTTESFNNGGVTNENPLIEVIPIASAQDSFSEDSDALKTQTFDNMSFADAYLTFPQLDKVHILEYNITDFDISPDDAYNYMCKRLDELFPGMFNDEEKAKEIRFCNLKGEEKPTFDEYKVIDEKKYRSILTAHPSTQINLESDKSKECCLYIMNGVLERYDNGYLAKRCGYDRPVSSFNILEEFHVVYRTENLESERIFHLESGDISIAEAVRAAEKQLSEFEYSERELPVKLRVHNVNVVDIGDECYAFCFGIVPEYKGLKFNCMLPDNSVYGFWIISNTTNTLDVCGEEIMCETDKICRFRQHNIAAMYDFVERGSSTSIVPLKNAAEITSEYLTQGIKFNVLSVSAAYKTFSEKDIKDFANYDDYEKRLITVKPCWRFVLQPLTGNTNRLYYIFVDMITGEAYSTVQQMESEVEYD